MPKGKSLTTKEVANRITSLSGGEYKLVSEYTKDKVKVKIKHLSCGNVYETRASHFFSGSRCPKHINEINPKDFEEDFYKLAGSDYTLLSTYIRSHLKVKVRHNKCGNIYEVTPHMFKSGQRCPTCFGNNRKTIQEFSKEVETLTGYKYQLMSPYVNNRESVKIKHLKCNHIYDVRPHDFLSGNRCPFCKQSKGEQLIADILDNQEIEYIIQYVFNDLGNKNQRLPFDFFIPSHNLLIEYDGIQHYKPVTYFGGDKKLLDQQRRDNLKNEYAKRESIRLLRIPYTLSKDEITNIIKKYLFHM